MIRVLHYGLSSNLGGIETYLYKIYNNIDHSKYQFDFLIVGKEKPCWYEEFSEMGSNFYFITSRSTNPLLNKKELIELYENENFDIIHCHMNSLSYTLPITMAVKMKKKVIVHSRNAKPPKSFSTRLLHNLNSFLLPKKKIKMLAVSDLAGQWMFGEKNKFITINNGIDIEKFKFSENARRKLRDNLNIENDYCIVHVGAFRPQKNHQFLLEVFSQILNKKSNSKLLLLGTGTLMPSIIEKSKELKLENKILFLQNRDDVAEILSASDAFLFPSLYEGFPNAVLEAETSGLPTLISTEITNQVLINDNCKSFSLTNKPNEWANKLLSLGVNLERDKSSENIRKQGFSVKDEVKTLEKIYHEILF